MIQFFRNMRFHAISFWAGFVAATLLWWLLRYLKPYLHRGWQKIKSLIQATRQGVLTNTDQRHRNDTIKLVQGYHLASPLFSLDEVMITPRLMAPPPVLDPDQPTPYEDTITATIPFTPDYPEIAAAYDRKSLRIFEALQLGANLIITGNPGIGKSTALAYIASKISRQDPEAGNLQNLVPFFIHAANLILPEAPKEDPLDILFPALSSQASTLTVPRLQKMVYAAFASGKAILLLDGLDEVSNQDLEKLVAYLRQLLSTFPNLRMIVSACPNHIGELPTLGLVPIPLAAWNSKTQAEFLHRWRDLWQNHIAPAQKDEMQQPTDPMLMNGWLLNTASAVAPLEFTLKIWALFAGDVRGPGIIDSLEAYYRRLVTHLPKARLALELLASHALINAEPAFSDSQIRDWLAKDRIETSELELVILDADPESPISPRKVSVPRILPDLLQAGLIIPRMNQRYSFVHPILAAYLGGTALARRGSVEIFSQPDWPLKLPATTFMASLADLSPFITESLTDQNDPLQRNLLALGRWLQVMPGTAPGRKKILQTLSGALQNGQLALGMRLRILTALVTSGDPGIPNLLHYLLNAQDESVRKLAILGCGYLRDSQFVSDLIQRLKDTPHVSQAACLALVNIDTKPALEAVASVILHADELLRRTAAEAFANHPKEGYPILVDGSKADDLMVRRATVYGLKRVTQPWATQILEQLQVEDSQWVVKDAAAQAVTQLKYPDSAVPRPQPSLADLPWLIAFAGDHKMGLRQGDPARDMLLRVLHEGSSDQILAAMGQIRLRGETRIFPIIYHILFGLDPELQEAAFHTIWHIASMGIKIPPLSKFGLP